MNKKMLYTVIAALSLTMAQGVSAATFTTTLNAFGTQFGGASNYTAPNLNTDTIKFSLDTSLTTGTISQTDFAKINSWKIEAFSGVSLVYTDVIISGGVVQNLLAANGIFARTVTDIGLSFNLNAPKLLSWDSYSPGLTGIDANGFFGQDIGTTTESSMVSPGGSTIDFRDVFTSSTVVTPLPAAVWLFGTGLAGLMAASRRKKSQLNLGNALAA